MRVTLGDIGLPPCQDTTQASSISCVVVPGVTRGTLTTANQGISNVVFGQVVDINQRAMDAYNSNTQAAAAAGTAIIATADPGAVPALSTPTATATVDTGGQVTLGTPEKVAIAAVVGLVLLRLL